MIIFDSFIMIIFFVPLPCLTIFQLRNSIYSATLSCGGKGLILQILIFFFFTPIPIITSLPHFEILFEIHTLLIINPLSAFTNYAFQKGRLLKENY